MCTDRPIPDEINDYRPIDRPIEHNVSSKWIAIYGTDMLRRLHDFEAQMYNYIVTADRSEYAKLAMQPMWSEIMMKMYPHIQSDSIGLNKLALFSGHDTTIIPLLASLGVWNDTAWPPYASMVIIELHEMNVDGNTDRKIFPSKFAFRLIYNGLVITPQMESCEPDLELCNVEILLNQLSRERNCVRKHDDEVPYIDDIARTKEIVATTDGLVYFLLVVSISAASGGMLVYLYFVKCFPKQHYNRAHDNDVEVDEIAINGDTDIRPYRDHHDGYGAGSTMNQTTEIS
jgi:hypothetical protein